MSEKIKAIQVGCGPVGCKIAKLALQKRDIELVGAIDLVNIGKDLGEVAGMQNKTGINITDDIDNIISQTGADIAMQAISSSLNVIYPQLEKLMKAGVNIVSSAEELSYPFNEQPELSAKIDEVAKAHNVTVLGTGVNPGFLMDSWPVFMTGVCQEVNKVKAVRVQDAGTRRLPFQKKIGAGLSIEEFNKLVEAKTLRHVGIPESIGMIAAGLGWKLDRITESLEPVISEKKVSSDYITVEPGQAAGVRQEGHGWLNGEEVITLYFQACLGYEETYDAVYITGIPDLEVVVKGGVHGDLATAAMVVNSIPRVIEAPAGLVTMMDLPLVSTLVNK